MRLPLAAALAALALVPSTASADAGAGVVAMAAHSFFRPGVGLVAAGACAYTGTILTGAATAVAVPSGTPRSVHVHCDLLNASGGVIGQVDASGGVYALESQLVQSTQTPVRVCGRVTAYHPTWIHPAVSGDTCAPVLPGNVAVG